MIKVIWDDAGSFCEDDDSPWKSKDEIQDQFSRASFINTSYGEVVFQTDDDLIIAQNIMEPKEGYEKQYSNYIRIPRAMILKIINLEN